MTMTLYDELVKDGYTHAIVLPVSSGLSGTINSFRLASENYKVISDLVFNGTVLKYTPAQAHFISSGICDDQRSENYCKDQTGGSRTS